MPLNMNKEYRQEIRTLKAAARKIERDRDGALKEITREMDLHERAIEKLSKQISRVGHAASRHIKKIADRIAVLEGRLS